MPKVSPYSIGDLVELRDGRIGTVENFWRGRTTGQAIQPNSFKYLLRFVDGKSDYFYTSHIKGAAD